MPSMCKVRVTLVNILWLICRLSASRSSRMDVFKRFISSNRFLNTSFNLSSRRNRMRRNGRRKRRSRKNDDDDDETMMMIMKWRKTIRGWWWWRWWWWWWWWWWTRKIGSSNSRRRRKRRRRRRRQRRWRRRRGGEHQQQEWKEQDEEEKNRGKKMTKKQKKKTMIRRWWRWRRKRRRRRRTTAKRIQSQKGFSHFGRFACRGSQITCTPVMCQKNLNTVFTGMLWTCLIIKYNLVCLFVECMHFFHLDLGSWTGHKDPECYTIRIFVHGSNLV